MRFLKTNMHLPIFFKIMWVYNTFLSVYTFSYSAFL